MTERHSNPSEPPLAERSLADLIAAIGSRSITPGSGAAAAVALALAAACAAKATAITSARRPALAHLPRLHGQLIDFAGRVLGAGDEEAILFEQFVRRQNAASVEPLLDTGERLKDAVLALLRRLDELAGEVEPVVSGDVAAARALCEAALAIVSENLQENQQAARDDGPAAT